MEIYMSVDDLSNQLGVSSSTIKKYYLLIEERGYKFRRNVQGHIAFTREDIDLFRMIFELKSQPKMTVIGSIDKALGVITPGTDVSDEVNVSRETEGDSTNVTDITVITETVNELKDALVAQNETIKNQSGLINEQSRMIDELLRTNRRSERLLENNHEDKNNEKSLLERNLAETDELKNMIQELQDQSQKKWWKFW